MKKISLAVSLFGILIIFSIILLIEPKETNYQEISTKNIGEQIKISGTTSNVKIHKNNFTTLSLDNQIEIICNCPNLKNDQKIEVIGRVSKYENELQIEADKISLII